MLALVCPVWLIGLTGCGANLDEILFQTVTAAGRTYVDLLLTDIANAIAANAQEPEEPANGDGENGGGGDGGNGGNGGGFDDLVGDAAAGETIYASNNCAACHCANASGGCALMAPPVVGASAETLDAVLRGSAPHPSKPDLSNQEIVDLEAYLGSI